MNADQAAFTGWCRSNKRQPWRRVTAAGTEAACWDALFAQAPAVGEKCVVAGTVDPNRKEAPCRQQPR